MFGDCSLSSKNLFPWAPLYPRMSCAIPNDTKEKMRHVKSRITSWREMNESRLLWHLVLCLAVGQKKTPDGSIFSFYQEGVLGIYPFLIHGQLLISN